MARKLLGLSLFAMLLLVSSAIAQPPVEFWLGGGWGGGVWDHTIVAVPGGNASVPVYFFTPPEDSIADLHLPLGVNDTYISDIPQGLCTLAPPLIAWDDASFLGTFDVMVGYHSRSLLGFCDLIGGPNPFLRNEIMPPIICATFVITTINNPAFIPNTYTDALATGNNPANGGPSAGDPSGGAGYAMTMNYADLYFPANQAPIISPIDDLVDHTVCPTFTVVDPDGPPPLTVTADHGVISGSYQICIPAGYCGPVVVTAGDGAGGVATEPFEVLNSAPVITYLGPDPVVATSVVGFDIVDANNDMITPTVSGTCVVTITTNVAGHLAGTIAATSGCNGTIQIDAVDPCGAAATPVSFVVNILNSAPVINASFGPAVEACEGVVCYPFTVTDDGIGTIVVTATYGTIIMDSYVVDPGVSSLWTGSICFDPMDVCVFTEVPAPQYINATDGMDAAVPYLFGPVTISPVVAVDMPDANWFWPGFTDSIPVIINAADCFCLGGFELTVMYDASIFHVNHVTRGTIMIPAEYWYVNYNPAVEFCDENAGRTGALKVVMAWDLNNQIPNQELCGVDGEILFWIVGAVANNTYPVDFCVPICFYMCNMDYPGNNYHFNAVTDPTGNFVWKTEGCQDPIATTYFLDLDCGNIKINGDVPPGDVNGNGQQYEIGDVVALANYLGDPIGHPLTRMEWWSSDINQDGIPATIADLIMLIRYVTGQIPIPGGRVAPLNIAANAEMSGENVTIASDATIGGAVVTINHTGELGIPTANGMDIKYSDRNGVMTVLAYSNAGNALGHNISITVPIISGNANLASASVADIDGHMLNSNTANIVLPTEFAIAQNYPNPFNNKTAINVSLPTSAIVSVAIYNVAGQLIQTLNPGELIAGNHSIVWDASNVGSGVYFSKVTAGDFSKTMKMTLLK